MKKDPAKRFEVDLLYALLNNPSENSQSARGVKQPAAAFEKGPRALNGSGLFYS